MAGDGEGGDYVGGLDGFVEQGAGVAHEVLVHGAVKGHVDGHGLLLPAPRPPRLLPEGRDGACSKRLPFDGPFLGQQGACTCGLDFVLRMAMPLKR